MVFILWVLYLIERNSSSFKANRILLKIYVSFPKNYNRIFVNIIDIRLFTATKVILNFVWILYKL